MGGAERDEKRKRLQFHHKVIITNKETKGD